MWWRWLKYSVRFPNPRITVHPSAWVSDRAIFRLSGGGTIEIGENCEIGDFAVLDAFGGMIVLGAHCSVNPFCVLYGHGGLTIGNDVRIATHTVMIPANHNFRGVGLIRNQGTSQRGIIIGANCWLGANVTLLDGVEIGANSVIAAGSVVARSVPAGSLAKGVPAVARPIRPA